MEFRARLISTLRAIAPVLEVPGVLVIGSEVPNLLQPDAASTLVVSQDVDIGVPVALHEDVKSRLSRIAGLHPSPEEPSVWVPDTENLIEVNFLGIDVSITDPTEARVIEDARLPLMVFGALSFIRAGDVVTIESLRVPMPRPAGMILEKLLTDRSGVKGDRDLLVVAGILPLASEQDLSELGAEYRMLAEEHRYTVRSNLTTLSLMAPHDTMPDPIAQRPRVTDLLRRLEKEAR